MYALGIYVEEATLKVALLKKAKNKIQVEFTQCYSDNVKLFDMIESVLHGKTPIIITGLKPTEIVCRETSLKLKNERALISALPFQVETLIPYPPEEVILIPQFHHKDKQETDVILFATNKLFLKTHLQQMEGRGITPDIVSAAGVALARWGMLTYPKQKTLCLLQNGCAALVLNQKIAILQAYENSERVKGYILTKFPDVHFISVEDEYAIPIGLALEALQKNCLQFRQGEFTAPKNIEHRKRLKWRYALACLSLTLAGGGFGFYKIHQSEKALQKHLDTVIGPSSLSLQKRVSNWERDLSSHKKEFSLIPTSPSVTDVLAWISSKKHEIEVVHLHYTLVNYPKLGESFEPYQAKVDLEFNAPSPKVAREFHVSLAKEDPFIDPKYEVIWNVSQNLYKTSFYLRTQ